MDLQKEILHGQLENAFGLPGRQVQPGVFQPELNKVFANDGTGLHQRVFVPWFVRMYPELSVEQQVGFMFDEDPDQVGMDVFCISFLFGDDFRLSQVMQAYFFQKHVQVSEMVVKRRFADAYVFCQLFNHQAILPEPCEGFVTLEDPRGCFFGHGGSVI